MIYDGLGCTSDCAGPQARTQMWLALCHHAQPTPYYSMQIRQRKPWTADGCKAPPLLLLLPLLLMTRMVLILPRAGSNEDRNRQ